MDIQKASKELLSNARLLPRHTFTLFRNDVSQIVNQLDSLERYLQSSESASPENDSIQLRLSEVHFILSECRYHQFCTIVIYLLIVVSFSAFLFWI
ncbi:MULTISPECIES: hypothetical protein [Vibrio harveyi group]|uniref:Uncharacterized protein n=1 Tax=Vibrio jasicida TaxID=766224 RepID=A0AAU9R206_9VIBR|nr:MULTISPECIES: hypothetical protein [Vibrio harveyi group]EKH9212750.1 hypothetical protein [Vibrio parahaemolyticus]CAH1603269.1 hypothetical protein THF1C08_970002 [Vibrio jasicida]HDM8209316.1 hypothetical protein [Vibrio campbellii]WJT10954.1 hypothetical protein PH545_28105 [Vibrio harveyi]CAH1604100.1 hypothetical protein THF1A12_950002 [Vibrio jasicida]